MSGNNSRERLWPWLLATSLLAAGMPAQEQPPRKPPAEPAKPIPIPIDLEAEQQGQPIRELTLKDALRLGRMNNIELRAAELLPQEASQDLLFAEAGFQPELYGDLGYAQAQSPTRNAFQPSLDSTTSDATLGWRQRVVTGGLFDLAFHPTKFTTNTASGAFPSVQYTSEWSINYTQPLLRGAWTDYNLANINIARHGVTRAQRDFERTVQDTLEQIVEGYWELVFARENFRVLSESLAVAKEQLRITEERIRVRELAPRDRVADEAEVARREEERIGAEHETRRRQDNLRRLVFDDQHGDLWRWNLRPTDDISVVPRTEPIDIEPLVEVAMRNRPDLASLRSGVAAAELVQMQAGRDVLPALDLVSTYGSEGVRDTLGAALGDANDQQYPDWGLRLQFAIPIGNQAARARLRRAQLEVERQQRDLYAAMMDVVKEVRESVRNIQSLAQSIRASGESVRLADSNLETEQVKLRVGSSTIFEVQRRNQELREARSRHLRNQVAYRVAESRLLLAQGILQEPRD